VPAGGVAVAFTATATASATASAGLTWGVNGVAGGNATVGTISAAGLYLSPAVVPSHASVTISAISTADPAQSGSATLTLTAAQALISLSVMPATASIQAGVGTLTFTAIVSNTSNTAVVWQVNGVVGGNATIGTIAPTGVYTPPATPPAQPSVTVTAVSSADPTKRASASVMVTSTSMSLTINGTPATSVTAGHAYAFTPTASSPGGAALTFSISGKPSWASFNAATGQLSGTPATTDIGTYANISISVSNSTATASLAPFTITVQSGSTGSATVSWKPPTARVNGSPLATLAGFHIYYGTASGSYPNEISVTGANVSTYVVDNLPGGVTYYFVMTAYDASGLESAYTSVGSKAIP
jgi:hypothetical protein